MIKQYKRLLFVILLLVIDKSSALEYKSISAETNYIKHKNESLISTINSEYNIPFYVSSCESWALTIGGKLSFDFDHFSNEIKTNAFTTIGLEF